MGTPISQDHSTLLQQLLDMILEPEFREGALLPSEAQLMERFGCARSSLREAMKQLQTLGLVEIRRGIGTYVRALSARPLFQAIGIGTVLRSRSNPRAFLELLETRIAMDVGMAEKICAVMQGKPDAELDQIVDDMIAAASEGSRFKELDQRFHHLLQSKVGNDFALSLVTNFWDVFDMIDLDSHIGTPVPLTRIAETHRLILDAAYAGDIEAYRDALNAHYASSQEQARLFAEEFKESTEAASATQPALTSIRAVRWNG